MHKYTFLELYAIDYYLKELDINQLKLLFNEIKFVNINYYKNINSYEFNKDEIINIISDIIYTYFNTFRLELHSKRYPYLTTLALKYGNIKDLTEHAIMAGERKLKIKNILTS